MHIKILIFLSFFAHQACFSIPNFELYNSLPCTIYYALCNNDAQDKGQELLRLGPYTYVHNQVDPDKPIHLIVVKELPETDQLIPLYAFDLSRSENIYIKTCQTRNTHVRIIPQTTLQDHKTQGQLPLKNNIDHHDIWLTKATYQKPPMSQESSVCNPTNPIKAHEPFDLNSTQTVCPTLESMQNSAQPSVDQSISETVTR